jgi:hypothetical protein
LLTCAAAQVSAQVSAVSPQGLFFDQAAIGAHRGNYLEADAGVIYTDNVYLEPNGPGDTLGMLGLIGDLERAGTRLDYRLDSNLSVVKYLHSDFQTQPFGYADGSGELKIVPGFFSWTARDTYNNLVINPLDPITPDNLETINYFTTGPRFTLTPTLRTSIVLDGYYSFVTSSSNSPQYVNINNRRYGGDLTMSRAFTASTSAYITGTVYKIEYSDTAQNTDFRSNAVNGGFKYSDARTFLDISGGYQRLHTTVVNLVPSEIGIIERTENETPGGANWQANLSRVISPKQRVSLYATRLIADSSSLFQQGIGQPVPNLSGNLLVNGQPFTYTTYGATWRFEASRTTLQVNISQLREEYEFTPTSNTTSKWAGVLLTRKLSPVLKWELGATYGHNDYAGSTNHAVNVLTSLRWQVGRRFSLRFVYARSTQSSPGSYTADQVGIVAGYALTAPGTGTPPPEEPTFLQPVAPGSSQPWQVPAQQPSPPQ